MERMGRAEKLNWFFTIGNTLNDVIALLTKTHENLPEGFKQRLPGFLGLSLADERIFNGVFGQLSPEQQVAIGEFLYECKDYERNRFINIVAGMEVVPGRLEKREEKWDKHGTKTYEKFEAGSEGLDQRKKFLESFAELIKVQFNNDYQKAYAYCVAGRLIIEDPLHQKTLRAFSESIKWFKDVILVPLGVDSVAGAIQKVKQHKKDFVEKIKEAREINKQSFWRTNYRTNKTGVWIFVALAVVVTAIFAYGFLCA